MPHLSLVAPLPIGFAWDGDRLLAPSSLLHRPPGGEVRGAFATVVSEDGELLLARDPLGLGKLFFAEREEELVVADRLCALTEVGFHLDECWALPPGIAARRRAEEQAPALLPLGGGPAPPFDFAETPKTIRRSLESYIAAVTNARPGPALVCLSGGLDSAVIAAMLKRQRPDATAVCLDLGGGDGNGSSDDFHRAAAIAVQLDLPLLRVAPPLDQMLAALDEVLLAGSDWRDFNVHAGLLNAALAKAIAEDLGDERAEVTVFTGDIANELLADYRPHPHRGKLYYRLPDLPPRELREILVRGLQSTAREIGVFATAGLSIVQPFAIVAPEMMGVPARFLGSGDGKQELYRILFGDLLPAATAGAVKIRAQIGSTSGSGVLGACLEAGIDAGSLERRFGELHGGADQATVRRLVRAGRSRSKVPRLHERRGVPG